MGSVSPLLAVADVLRDAGDALHFVGTGTGPERDAVKQAGIEFSSIAAPKLRRYLSWQHLFIPVQLCAGLAQSFGVLRRIRPEVIVSAGGFVSVPVVWMGWLMRVPAVIHQQDIRPGLANRLMQPFAKKITVSFERSLTQFPPETAWIGNPVRDLSPTTDAIQLDPDYPTVLLFGGGTGAQRLNELVSREICEQANLIHLTGTDRDGADIDHPRYHRYGFLKEEMKEALHKADVVVCRAGLGTISELSALGKPAVIIPMPDTHQEENASLLKESGAAVVLQQEELTQEALAKQLRLLLNDDEQRANYSRQIRLLMKPDASRQFASIIHDAGTR